ncbi:Crp/Fnr family transcriptional regulator [Adhaeribacter pallidiroseus]|uniref:Non-specific serine/threonine protein kinase n=1 Tax=Adhaeribacter pallidiroseus TaxID=2072847 RepID=A0A369QLD7_9BACT|nr:Crp/Fnr family transcriptional regulator [Adhaeribacter pallidiroseus]RDC65524.1 Non-specific serine/threonine protein kinase [Adhaeribacter pallidiroseus]
MTADEIYSRARASYTTLVVFTDAEWHAFQQQTQIRYLARKEHFLRQGSVCTHCAYVAQGYVRHYYLVDGKEVTNDFNFENMATGGYQSLMTQTPVRFNIVAMEPTTLITFTRPTLLDLFEHYPNWQKLGRLMMEGMFNRKTLREESFLLDTPEERYQQLIIRQPFILQRVPLVYIASYLGITPETLSRIRRRK